MNKYIQVPDSIIDLHGYTTAEARAILDDELKENIKHLRVITGKGNHSEYGPVLRDYVKNYLNDRRIRFSQSKIQDGGEGSLEVFL